MLFDYFMHLRCSSKLSQVVLVAGLFWFGILIALIDAADDAAVDHVGRGRQPSR